MNVMHSFDEETERNARLLLKLMKTSDESRKRLDDWSSYSCSSSSSSHQIPLIFPPNHHHKKQKNDKDRQAEMDVRKRQYDHYSKYYRISTMPLEPTDLLYCTSEQAGGETAAEEKENSSNNWCYYSSSSSSPPRRKVAVSTATRRQQYHEQEEFKHMTNNNTMTFPSTRISRPVTAPECELQGKNRAIIHQQHHQVDILRPVTAPEFEQQGNRAGIKASNLDDNYYSRPTRQHIFFDDYSVKTRKRRNVGKTVLDTRNRPRSSAEGWLSPGCDNVKFRRFEDNGDSHRKDQVAQQELGQLRQQKGYFTERRLSPPASAFLAVPSPAAHSSEAFGLSYEQESSNKKLNPAKHLHLHFMPSPHHAVPSPPPPPTANHSSFGSFFSLSPLPPHGDYH